MAERRLAVYRDYLHHLTEAISTIPAFLGVVYRGIDCKLNPASYAVGSTITWQQFSSASKKAQQARKFLQPVGASGLGGSLFVIEVKTGREIDAFSAFPEEEEVGCLLEARRTVGGRWRESRGGRRRHVGLS